MSFDSRYVARKVHKITATSVGIDTKNHHRLVEHVTYIQGKTSRKASPRPSPSPTQISYPSAGSSDVVLHLSSRMRYIKP